MSVSEACRYLSNSQSVRLPMLLPGAITAWQGLRAEVVDVEERVLDSGRWAVRLRRHPDAPMFAVSGPATAQLPVFTDPYQVCSCHGEPWPCNVAFAAIQAKREQQRQQQIALHRCHSCGSEKNLGRYRSDYPEARRYCRRVGCTREAERWERERHNARHIENREREAFAGRMREALGGPPP